MEASIFSFEDRLQLCFNPEGESAAIFPLTHRGVRERTTTTAFEAVVFERESEVMNRASYEPRSKKNLRTTDRGG
jgi:hypothetical protein